MTATSKGMLRTLATRGIVAAIPVAMVSAYASGIFVPPHRNASFDFTQVAEINVSPSTVGVAESPLYGMTTDQINTQLNQLQALGVQNIRVFVPWGLIEQSPNTYDWSSLDRVMQAAAARNMGVMAEINATPTWAGPNPNSPGFPLGADTPNTAAFTGFLQQFVDKYKTTVSAYEIWNEPNSVQFFNPISPEAYASLLEAAYPIIKNPVTGDPTATVVAGAVGATQDSPFTMNPVTFIQRMLAAGAGSDFDALSFHPYNTDIPFSGSCPTCAASILTPREQLDAIKAMIGTDKTIWISEYGLPTVAGTADQAKQAQYIMDLINYWQGYSQAGPIFLYTGQDTATGSTDPEDNYGLYNQDGTPKAVVADLAAYYLAHPQNPTTPTDPTGPTNPPSNPGNAIGTFLQQFFQNLGNAIANAFGQNLVNALVSAITNFFAGFGAPAAAPAPLTTAAPLTLKVASVQAPVTASVTVASADVAASPSLTPAGTQTLAPTAATGLTAPAVAQAATTPAAPAVAASTGAPATDLTMVSAPVATVPAVTPTPVTVAPTPVTATPTPVATEPVVVKPPAPPAPVATKADPTEAAATPAGSATGTPSTDNGATPGASKSGDGDHQRGKGPKSGDSDKTGSDKTGSDKTDSGSHRLKGKGDNGFSGAGAKPKAEATGAQGTTTVGGSGSKA